ncbi:MAG: hypothetical protein HYX62_06980 [Gammaproteobacteria bacterium]|nr:hypothetical protein [Gammaproteobacteria bacterium]
MSERLQIYQITTLEEMLKNVRGKLIEHAPLAKPPRFNPLINVLNQVIAHGCKVVIKQYPVQDPDFFAEYNAYYSRIFANVDKYCERLHFFSLPLTDQNETALDYIDRIASIPNSYIGFSTIRPVRSSPIGATILRPPKGSHFVLCRDVFPVHLAGQTFSVTGTPFMQQDNAVGACAQTSIWMALRTLRKKEGNSAFDPAQITNAATRFLIGGRTLPNREGLQINQMIEAIRNAGYSTHVCTFRSSGEVMSNPLLQSVKRTLYTYVESEIPVILALYPESGDGHAVVLIGHGWDANIINRVDVDIPLSANNATQVCHAVSWVNHFGSS